MSRPQTPHGISPRGSYVNLLEGREEGTFSPSKIEKERLRAEAEVNAALLREKEGQGDKKKEEPPVAVGSPGMSPLPPRQDVSTPLQYGEKGANARTVLSSPAHLELLRRVHYDDGRQQICRLWLAIHNDLSPWVLLSTTIQTKKAAADDTPPVLTIQSAVCVACVYSVKQTGIITCELTIPPRVLCGT